MPRGAKKRKQLVATCTECNQRLGTRFVYNANNMLATFKERFSQKYCSNCRQKQQVKYKEEKHSS